MKLKIDFLIKPRSGKAFHINKGDFIKIIDFEGKQVADFTAINPDDLSEHLSMPATIDNNNSLKLKKGQLLYSNKYEHFFELIEDTVGTHDLIHPMCRTEMFNRQYGINSNHASCHNNIIEAFKEKEIIVKETPVPLNVFMNTAIQTNGKITVEEPISKAGDFILLKAKKNLIVAIAACSVEESKCNGFKCGSISVQIFHPSSS